MPESEPQFYDRAIRRIRWFILVLGLSGAVLLASLQGPRMGFGFLVGAAVSFLSFWRWQQIVEAFAADQKRRRSYRFFVLRILVFTALAYVIIRFLGLNIAAAVSGLLVSGAAVILELVYELIYARA